MKHENVHDFFHNISRVTIVLPIIIIALGIILKPKTQVTPQVQSKQTVSKFSVSPTVSISKIPSGVPINLTGPLVCTFDPSSGYTGTLYIKNKNIYANILPKDEVATMSVLLKDDCVYKWQIGAKIGVKICSISQYVSMLNTLSNFKMLDADTVMSIISKFGEANGATNIPKNVVPPVCKTETVVDTMFDLPKIVRFELKSTPKLIPQ